MIGRPERSEAASYYFTYIDQTSGNDPVAAMLTQLDETVKFCSSLSEEKSLYRYAAEKWSIRQVLNHLTDTERAFAFRALWFSRGFETPLPGIDQNIAVAGAGADSTSWAAHIEEFGHVRRATIALFKNMPAETYMRSGIASDNPFTVRALAFIIVGHVAHHIRIVKERYL